MDGVDSDSDLTTEDFKNVTEEFKGLAVSAYNRNTYVGEGLFIGIFNYSQELHGVQPGDRVAALLKNGIEFVETYFALAKIGAVMVPVNWRLVGPEIAYILADSGSRALVFDADFDAVVTSLQDSGAATLPITTWIRSTGGSGDPVEGVLDYESLLNSGSTGEPPVGAGGDGPAGQQVEPAGRGRGWGSRCLAGLSRSPSDQSPAVHQEEQDQRWPEGRGEGASDAGDAGLVLGQPHFPSNYIGFQEDPLLAGEGHAALGRPRHRQWLRHCLHCQQCRLHKW